MATIDSALGPNVPMAEPSNSNEAVGDDSLDRQDFMTLFMTQLQHQDPMKPMDSHEMAAQLAQFSNMEATMKMSDNMEKLLDYQKSQNNLQLLGLIGENIETEGNELSMVDGAADKTSYVLEEPAASSVVYIYGPGGQLARSMDMGYQEAGEHTLAWDGQDNNGELAPDGPYTYKVEALTPEGQEVGVERRASGKVTGLDFNTGQATITVNDHAQKGVGDIIRVH
ncbi:MAG: flagellar hook assembly protein FlgD [Desulfurivibrio sp.]|nr:flagellar hook assembly protein FlgD [Desulfurivibrio sp.]